MKIKLQTLPTPTTLSVSSHQGLDWTPGLHGCDQHTKHMFCCLYGALFCVNDPHADTIHVPHLLSCSLWLVICYFQLFLPFSQSASCLFSTTSLYTYFFSPLILKIVLECEMFDNTCYSGHIILQKDLKYFMPKAMFDIIFCWFNKHIMRFYLCFVSLPFMRQ